MEWLKKYKGFDSPRKRVKFFRSHVIDMHQSNMLFSSGLDPFILHEIESSFEQGNFIACILLCQLAVEHCLANIFLLTEHESICTKGFAQLISKASELDAIDNDMESQLTELRLMRNPYVHPRFGDGKGTIVRRVIDKKLDYNELPVADGIRAINIFGNYLNKKS
jgi:HEPN domain-containing protein